VLSENIRRVNFSLITRETKKNKFLFIANIQKMYFAVGWSQKLHNLSQQHGELILSVTSNNNRQLIAVLLERTVSLWSVKPIGELFFLRRSDDSVKKFGTNVSILWKSDTGAFVVSTSLGYMIFYQILEDVSKSGRNVFIRTESRNVGEQNEFVEMNWGEHINALQIKEASRTKMIGNITNMTCFREEIFVTTAIGLIYRVRWDGSFQTELTIPVNSIAYSVDLQQSRLFQLTDPDIFINEIKYCSSVGGFAIVLSNGRLAFVTAASVKHDQNAMVGVLAQDMNSAVTVAINSRYRLIACGCNNGEGVVYCVNDLTGALQSTHKLSVSSKEFPDFSSKCGSVSKIQWSPDGSVLAMVWQMCGFAVWSVFGSLIHHSLAPDMHADDSNVASCQNLVVQSMDWSAEGYYMWMVCHEEAKQQQQNLYIQNFVKTALAVNACKTNQEHLLLQGDDRIYLYPKEPVAQQIHVTFETNRIESASPSVLLGNRQWQVILLSQPYLQHNWPVRLVAVDYAGSFVAVAGRFGFAFFSRHLQRWKLFGNESQERDFTVTGGLLWWEDYVCAACYNIRDRKDEIRFYPRDCKLDNAFVSTTRITSPITLLNCSYNILVALCADFHIMLFSIDKSSVHTTDVILTKLQEIPISHYVPHPVHVTGIALSSIRTETVSKHMDEGRESESILLNVAGRVLLFQRDRSGPQLKVKDKDKQLPFCIPSGVAQNVENMWLCSSNSDDKMGISEALWLSCGAAGMKVWLPLHHKEGGKTSYFMSRRIMLPFECDIIPLALLFDAGVVLGVTSEAMSMKYGRDSEQPWPYRQLQRTSQVFLHHIVRQLLRRNLGNAALDVARHCRDLPYFTHVLELLLHEVLEEEATSKEPIPDPLLPRIVAFINEFPEYLQVVVHCTRKTEVALWDHLFSIVGNPKDLFEECLMCGQLKSAASYLIVLQNLEKPFVARQHAKLLLEAALEKFEWNVVRELLRFLRAIDPSEEEMLSQSKTKKGSYSTLTTPPQTPNELLLAPLRHFSISRDDKENVTKGKPKVSRMDSAGRKRSPSGVGIEESSSDELYVDVILTRHARRLLSEYRLRDLARFATNLHDYQLISWMKKEKDKTGHIEDFPAALKRLHADFNWPLPILSLATLRKVNSDSVLNMKAKEAYAKSRAIDNGNTLPVNRERVHTLREDVEQLRGPADVLLQKTLVQVQFDSESLGSIDRSEASSGIDDADSLTSTQSGDIQQMSQELVNKGSHKSEMELRYLLHIVLEAGYIEWGVLLAIILRDSAVLIHTFSVARLLDTTITDLISRLKSGITALQEWANVECIGYKSFLDSVGNEISDLEMNVRNAHTQTRSGGHLPKSATTTFTSDQSVSAAVNYESLKVSVDSAAVSHTDEYSYTQGSNSECIIS
jgi:hypothetical protein